MKIKLNVFGLPLHLPRNRDPNIEILVLLCVPCIIYFNVLFDDSRKSIQTDSF